MRKLPKEYMEDLLVRIAYHSSAMEGNTISLADTVTILLHETIPGKVNKREFYEIENHKQALEYLLEQLEDGQPLSTTIIRGLHEKLMDHLQQDKGQWKKNDNAIVGADFHTAPAHEVPILMKQWVDNFTYRLEQTKSSEEKVKIILEMHIQFERIHPFADGNGRTGRLVLLYCLLEQHLPPLIIPIEVKPQYIHALANQDTKALFYLLYPLILQEKDRIERFANKEKTTNHR